MVILAAPRGHLKWLRTLHINVEPILARFDFSQRYRLGLRVCLHFKMVPFPQLAAFSHFLRYHNLASTGHRCNHLVSFTYRADFVNRAPNRANGACTAGGRPLRFAWLVSLCRCSRAAMAESVGRWSHLCAAIIMVVLFRGQADFVVTYWYWQIGKFDLARYDWHFFSKNQSQ